MFFGILSLVIFHRSTTGGDRISCRGLAKSGVSEITSPKLIICSRGSETVKVPLFASNAATTKVEAIIPNKVNHTIVSLSLVMILNIL